MPGGAEAMGALAPGFPVQVHPAGDAPMARVAPTVNAAVNGAARLPAAGLPGAVLPAAAAIVAKHGRKVVRPAVTMPAPAAPDRNGPIGESSVRANAAPTLQQTDGHRCAGPASVHRRRQPAAPWRSMHHPKPKALGSLLPVI